MSEGNNLEKNADLEASHQMKLMRRSLGHARRLCYAIAGPVSILTLFGRFLDKKFFTAPWLFVAAIISSALISTNLIIHITLQIIAENNKMIEEETDSSKNKKLDNNINNNFNNDINKIINRIL